MKIILLKDVQKIGKKYDVKIVSDGHAINLLIPQGLAITATPNAIKSLEAEKAKMERERMIHEELLVKNLEGLKAATITIVGRANEKGHLFAGLHKEAIAEEIQKQTRLQIDPSFIQLEHPLKTIGEHVIEVRGGGKNAKLKIVIEKA
jgi:large subunit ribosomal protein L9